MLHTAAHSVPPQPVSLLTCPFMDSLCMHITLSTVKSVLVISPTRCHHVSINLTSLNSVRTYTSTTIGKMRLKEEEASETVIDQTKVFFSRTVSYWPTAWHAPSDCVQVCPPGKNVKAQDESPFSFFFNLFFFTSVFLGTAGTWSFSLLPFRVSKRLLEFPGPTQVLYPTVLIIYQRLLFF